jgi:hypothetical protein
MEEVEFVTDINLALKTHALERATILITYKGATTGSPFSQPVTVSTGTFLQVDQSTFVLTCAHALDKLSSLRAMHTNSSIQTVFSAATAETASCVSVECYDGYIVQPRSEQPAIDNGVSSLYDFCDLALMKLSVDHSEHLASYKKTLSIAEFAGAAPEDWVQLTGYRSQDVKADENLQHIVTAPFTFRTRVVSASDRLLCLQYDLDSHVALAIQPAGISGSAVYDDGAHFVGVVWGGNTQERALYACPARVVRNFLHAHARAKRE